MNWIEEVKKNKIPSNIFTSYAYKGLIDIIIPVYNDRQGLQETLFSMNIKNRYNIIIVDDCSTEASYDDIVNFFSQFHNIIITSTAKNGGPAVAKNTGAKICNNKYLMFMDAGDTFANVESIPQMEKIMEENDQGYFLSCAHYEEGTDASLKYIPPEHNRWMGKVYRTDFYKRNQLAFNEDSSFCNDDIGMNMLARLLATEEHILHYDEPTVIWHINQDSVTRKDNYDYFYKQNNMGTAKSAIYALQMAKKRFVHPKKVKELIYSVICEMYYNCLSTLNYKPEFYEEASSGAQYFYDNVLRDTDIDIDMLTDIFNITTAVKLKSEDWEPALLKLPQISFLDFLNSLENNLIFEKK